LQTWKIAQAASFASMFIRQDGRMCGKELSIGL